VVKVTVDPGLTVALLGCVVIEGGVAWLFCSKTTLTSKKAPTNNDTALVTLSTRLADHTIVFMAA
jgi:hypothetical protein